jgi:homocysteine S-methyltransferase
VSPIESAIVVLDGGLATELEARGFDLSDRLWSARLLLTEPDAIEAVHLAYFRAGARVATTASYQASIEGFAAAGYDRGTALAAIGRSVTVARAARDTFAAESGTDPGDLLIAGSVGPYGAMLADGSEYRGDYDPGPRVLADFHRPRMAALIEAGVDLLAFETIPTVREAEVLVSLLDEFQTQAWLSYQCRDNGSTAAGEPITEAAAIGTHPGIVAVGINCTSPRHLTQLLEAAGEATDGPLIAYPNGGDRWDATARRWVADFSGGAYDPATVASWTAFGATWLGGCCGTRPSEIATLAAILAQAAA